MPAILVVENDDLEQTFLLALITEGMPDNYSVLSAKTGIHALRAAKQNQPEIILTDLLLPDMDGIHMIRELRRVVPHACIAILTACTDFFCAQQAIRLNVYDYLLKPIKPKELKDLLLRAKDQAAKSERTEAKNVKTHGGNNPEKEKAVFLDDALKYIHSHFDAKISLEDVAGRVFINAQYFSRVFKKELGTSFTDYVNSLRVEKAKELLSNTNYTAYRIANECGFADPSYFNRVFYKYANQTPQKYRRLLRSRDGDETI